MTLESPSDCNEIKPVNPKVYQSQIYIRRTDSEAEAPMLWPPDVKSQLIRKDPDAGKDGRQKEKGMAEDEVFGWHHRRNGCEFQQASRDGEGQGHLSCCSAWGHRGGPKLSIEHHHFSWVPSTRFIRECVPQTCKMVTPSHLGTLGQKREL